jgi:hypothetical protein
MNLLVEVPGAGRAPSPGSRSRTLRSSRLPRRRCRSRGALALALALGTSGALAHPAGAGAQVTSRAEVLDEIRSLEVRAEVTGGAAGAALARELEALVVRELERTGILRELPPARAGECCLLRIDARLASSRGALRLGSGYTVRLDLGTFERVGRHDAWILLWQSRTLDGVVDSRDLPEILRAQVRELAVEFTDRYLERFPPR